MKKILVSGTAAIAVAMVIALATVTPARAETVATIGGCYDCGQFDTASLIFENTTGGTLTNAQMLLRAYQGANNGLTATVDLGTLAGGTTQIFWGSLPGVSNSTTPGNLTAYDYDDEFNQGTGSSFWLGGLYPDCNDPADPEASTCADGGGPYWYAQTGNFRVTFTAMVSGGAFDGQSVFSVFSPNVNATGGFVGWEGLDAAGYSENPLYDVHTGIVTGHLADINLGTVPEPDTFSLMLGGLGLVAIVVRHKARLIQQ